MAAKQTKSAYEQEFIDRTRAARKSRFRAQADLCELLGIEQGTYKWYETNRLMPHDLVPRFCMACGVDPNWLFTGKGQGVTLAPEPRKKRRARTNGPPLRVASGQ